MAAPEIAILIAASNHFQQIHSRLFNALLLISASSLILYPNMRVNHQFMYLEQIKADCFDVQKGIRPWIFNRQTRVTKPYGDTRLATLSVKIRVEQYHI